MTEQERTEKAYCCGNSAQREAKLIAKFDLVLASLGIIGYSIFLSILINSEDPFSDSVANHPQGNKDISTFLQLPRGVQIGVAVTAVISNVGNLCIAGLLLFAAIKRQHKPLLIWYIVTITMSAMSIIGFITILFYLHDKVAVCVAFVVGLLYKWYCLWIVKILMREITSVGEGESYVNPIEGVIEGEQMETGIVLDKF